MSYRKRIGRSFNPISYTKAEKMMDQLFARKVKERDKGTCQRCGSKDMVQCAHLFSRSYKSIRWDFNNAITLCRGCHKFWAHVKYEEFRDFMIVRLGQEKFDYLKKESELDWHMSTGELLLMHKAMSNHKWKKMS